MNADGYHTDLNSKLEALVVQGRALVFEEHIEIWGQYIRNLPTEPRILALVKRAVDIFNPLSRQDDVLFSAEFDFERPASLYEVERIQSVHAILRACRCLQ